MVLPFEMQAEGCPFADRWWKYAHWGEGGALLRPVIPAYTEHARAVAEFWASLDSQALMVEHRHDSQNGIEAAAARIFALLLS